MVEATSGREGLAAGFSRVASPEALLLGLLGPADLLSPPDAGLLAPADGGLLPPDAGLALAGWADAAAPLDPLAASPFAGFTAGLGLPLLPAVAPEACFCTFLAGAMKMSLSSKESSSDDSSCFTAFTRHYAVMLLQTHTMYCTH